MRLPRALRNASLVVGGLITLAIVLCGRACAAASRRMASSRWTCASALPDPRRRIGSAPTISAATCGARMIFGARISLSIALMSVGVAATIGSAGRADRRLFRRLGRPPADAHHRHLPRLSGADPRARDRRRPRARGRQRLDRAHRRLLDRVCAGRARNDPRRCASRPTFRRRARSAPRDARILFREILPNALGPIIVLVDARPRHRHPLRSRP